MQKLVCYNKERLNKGISVKLRQGFKHFSRRISNCVLLEKLILDVFVFFQIQMKFILRENVIRQKGELSELKAIANQKVVKRVYYRNQSKFDEFEGVVLMRQN